MIVFVYTQDPLNTSVRAPAFFETIVEHLEALKHTVNLHRYRLWASQELGVGFTPLIEIPKEVNPYLRKDIHIYYKPEFLNTGGSGKGRSVSFMLYYYHQLGLLNGVKIITTAGFGNFIRTLTEIMPRTNFHITPKANMSSILWKENPDLVHYLQSQGALIAACDDGYCPTGDMDRGKAISQAYIEDQTEDTVLMFDQHAVFKPMDGILNAAGYYYGLAPEISHQTAGMKNLCYINGEGTRGSLVGTAAGLKRTRPDVKIIGLRQHEGGHIFGLRSAKQLGRSQSLGEAEALCDSVYTISDHEAYTTMLRLWKAGIPATPSGGSYIAGALRLANTLDEPSSLVTIIFDSIDFYQTLLNVWMPQILGIPVEPLVLDNLRRIAFQAREDHGRRLKEGRNELYEAMYNGRTKQ